MKTNMADHMNFQGLKPYHLMKKAKLAYKYLQAVDILLKPAWLCDLFQSDLSEMKKVILYCTEVGFLRNTLCVLQIGTDILVLHKDYALQTVTSNIENIISGTLSKSSQYIVLGNGLAPCMVLTNLLKEKLIKNLRHVCTTLKKDDYAITCRTVLPDEELTPTVFGALLNYPVIYVLADSDIILEPMDLLLFEAKLENSLNNKAFATSDYLDQSLYSFTIPVHLEGKCTEVISNWKNHILEKSKSINVSIVFSVTKRIQETVTL